MNFTSISPKLIGDFCVDMEISVMNPIFFGVNIELESWAHSLTLPNLVQCGPWILHRRGKQ